MSKLRAIMGQAPQKEYAVFFGHVIENRPPQIFELSEDISSVNVDNMAQVARWLFPIVNARRVAIKDIPEHIKAEAAELGYELDTSGKPITEKWFSSLGLRLADQVNAIVQIQQFIFGAVEQDLPQAETVDAEGGKASEPTGS